ncbi:hypothetical protein PoMZ_05054, partial [Pyricularia oryzae]
MPTISFAPVYVLSANRKFRKAGDTPYISIYNLVPLILFHHGPPSTGCTKGANQGRAHVSYFPLPKTVFSNGPTTFYCRDPLEIAAPVQCFRSTRCEGVKGCLIDSKNRRVVFSLISLFFKPYCLIFRGRTFAFPVGKVFLCHAGSHREIGPYFVRLYADGAPNRRSDFSFTAISGKFVKGEICRLYMGVAREGVPYNN